jgi:hypothetical protein
VTDRFLEKLAVFAFGALDSRLTGGLGLKEFGDGMRAEYGKCELPGDLYLPMRTAMLLRGIGFLLHSHLDVSLLWRPMAEDFLQSEEWREHLATAAATAAASAAASDAASDAAAAAAAAAAPAPAPRQRGDVRVDIVAAKPGNAPVTTRHRYDAAVTLSIEAADGTLTPAGWSTRAEAGGDGKPFAFTPGQGLIEGWSQGVLGMREGERAHIHVPASMGYGARAQGRKGGGWYIPGNSNLHFDIEITGKAGKPAAKGH